MAGFEVIVRPAVFPSIRPAQARPIAPADNPDKGLCVISGTSGQTVDLTSSYSVNSSQSRPVETSRRVDTARVYQQEDSGAVNRDNFVDVDVANKVTFKGFNGDDVQKTTEGRGYTGDDLVQFYEPVKERDNIEIKKRNQVKKADDE